MADRSRSEIDGVEVVAGKDMATGLLGWESEVAGVCGCRAGVGTMAFGGFAGEHLFVGQCAGPATSFRAHERRRPYEVHRQIFRYEDREERRGGELPPYCG